jgi:hypothetical protein
MQEPPPPPLHPVKNAPPPPPARALLAQMVGRTSDPERAQQLVEALGQVPTIQDLKLDSVVTVGTAGGAAAAPATPAGGTGGTGGGGFGGRGGGRGGRGGRGRGGAGGLVGTTPAARGQESQFTINFTYVPRASLKSATPSKVATPTNTGTGRRGTTGG